MNMIDRYLHEVGKYLPGKNREDILAEIRSHLSDTLDERVKGEASEEDVINLLKETGSPRKLAASYQGGQQYLIGPDQYPFFRMVAGIVLAAVIGAQLLAFGVNYMLGEEVVSYWESLAGLITSIPSAIGSVVIVFLILKQFGVKPDLEDGEWDPRTLPLVNEEEQIKKGERIFGIVFGSIILALLAAFPDKIGIYMFPGGTFYPNPVIAQNIGLIALSILVSIGMDIYLLWQGRWTMTSRIARLAVNVFSIFVLSILLQGHNSWLAEHGSRSIFQALESLGTDLAQNFQVVGMEAFRLAFFVALVVTIIETCLILYRLVRRSLAKSTIPVVTSER